MFNNFYAIPKLVNFMRRFKTLVLNLIFSNLNEGTAHWLTQRISSIILIPATVIFVFSFVQHIGADYEYNMVIYKNPTRSFFTFLFISLTLLHFKQGAQVVIEDYVQDDRISKILLRLNVSSFWGINLLLFWALARIVL